MGRKEQAGDARTIQGIQHGEMALVTDPESVKEMTIGGVSKEQYEWIDASRNRLNRNSGLTETMRGNVGSDVTATAESIAQQSASVRTDYLKREYQLGVARVFRAAAWFGFHGEDVMYQLGEESQRYGLPMMHYGGTMGRPGFNFFDMSIEIEPMSMDHTGQSMLQKRVQLGVETLLKMAPLMPQIPWINWREPLTATFNSLNINSEDWVDYDMLAQATQNMAIMQQQQQMMDLRLGNAKARKQMTALQPEKDESMANAMSIPETAGELDLTAVAVVELTKVHSHIPEERLALVREKHEEELAERVPPRQDGHP